MWRAQVIERADHDARPAVHPPPRRQLQLACTRRSEGEQIPSNRARPVRGAPALWHAPPRPDHRPAAQDAMACLTPRDNASSALQHSLGLRKWQIDRQQRGATKKDAHLGVADLPMLPNVRAHPGHTPQLAAAAQRMPPAAKPPQHVQDAPCTPPTHARVVQLPSPVRLTRADARVGRSTRTTSCTRRLARPGSLLSRGSECAVSSRTCVCGVVRGTGSVLSAGHAE